MSAWDAQERCHGRKSPRQGLGAPSLQAVGAPERPRTSCTHEQFSECSPAILCCPRTGEVFLCSQLCPSYGLAPPVTLLTPCTPRQ